ncbi:LysE family transporter [Alteromonadaceae bacterium BrNp21-10]|nr:LysE family transporter [Alteromonadaceae bacterium BrNp21-10]
MINEILLYRFEFLSIALVHLIAVASPGPDFAIVLKHSISYGRRVAIITSIGVGVAILLHVAYSLFGLGLLIKTTPWVFNVLSYAAAAYLAWIGCQGLRAKPSDNQPINQQQENHLMSDKRAFVTGFLTNGLNPKATLFFLSLFTVVISVQTPNSVKAFYGAYLALATALWFCLLSYLFSATKARRFIAKHAHWFDRVMGVVLILLALKLVVSSI